MNNPNGLFSVDNLLNPASSASSTSASLATRYTTKLTLTGSISGWNDASASAAGVPINGLYYTTGSSIRVRLS